MDPTTALAACQSALERYAAIWANDVWGGDYGNYHFWQKSNQVWSYLRFAGIASTAFVHVNGAPPKEYWYQLVMDKNGQPVTAFLDDFWHATESALQSHGFWADDYGWGGIACLTVARVTQAGTVPPGNSETTWKTWRDRAILCFKEMECALAQGQGGVPVAGGCANKPLVPPPDNINDPYLKNTVTNAVCFSLSMQIYESLKTWPVDPFCPITALDCITVGYRQYVWFNKWIQTTPNSTNGVLGNFYHKFNAAGISGGMLEDRPVAPAPLGTYEADGPGGLSWEKGVVWTGDQGLFLGAISLLLQYNGDLTPQLGVPIPEVLIIRTNAGYWIKSITAGIVNVLADSRVDNVLREPPYSMFYSLNGDPEDYLCGRGVLARNVVLPNTINMLTTVGINLTKVFGPTFAASAKNAAAYRDANAPESQLAADWNPSRNKDAMTTFWTVWDPQNPTKLNFKWPDHDLITNKDKGVAAVWQNYCMTNGFDIYSAFLRTSGWYPAKSESRRPKVHDNA